MTEHQNPTVWKLLPASDATDNARADQDARWKAGHPLPVEKYLEALPRVAADPELAMVLIYGEVLSRTEAGESPTLDEYRRRFPRFADHLAIQFQLHSALNNGSAPATNPADRTRPLAEGAGGDPLPDHFGPFRVREVIGRGGMGVVLAADDPALNRVVAIKTLRPGFVRAEAAARFAREARISAKVQHPAVPPVYAVGELPDGTPYLAMKRVRGRTLAELLLERSSPAANLPALLRTLEQVCQAVGFAHATGIIHRDLKPANVMVGEFGEVQVMDWGLAKELGTADFTPTGSADDQGTAETRRGTVLGTPAYMAPEQARGEPTDRRADVFALGAILCEVLTGHPPYSGRSAVDVVAKASAAELKPARKRLAECGADADLVALAERCLQPIRDNRPANGAEVAEAIARYHAATDDRLRAAERATAAAEAQAIEQRKRRRVQVTLAAAVILAVLIVGIIGTTLGLMMTVREAELVKQQAADEVRRIKAGQAVDRGIAQATELRKRSLWKQADAALTQAEAAATDDPDPDWATRLTTARKELALLRDLDAARLDRVFWQGKRGQKAESDKRYAGLFADHGFDVTGGDADELAARIRKSPIKAELLSALDDWAFGADTKATADKVLAVAKAVAGNSWRDLLNKKLPANENPPQARDLLAAVPPADRSPMLYLALSNRAKAAGEADTQILRDGVEQFPDDFWLPVYLAMAHEGDNALGDALSAYRTARALRPDSHQLLSEMGVICQKMRELPAAMRFYRQSLAMCESAPTLSNLGNVLREDGKLDEAIGMQQRATKADPTYANAWTNLGVALRDKGSIDDAVAAFRTAISLDPDDAAPRFNLGLALLTANKDPKGAIAEFEPIVERKLKLTDEEKGRVFTAWAHALSLLERWVEAEDKVRTALKANANDAESHYVLAEILCGQGKPKDAIPEYKEAIRLDPTTPKYHIDLGVELRKQGDVDEAIACYEKAIKLDGDNYTAHLNLGAAYLTRREYAKAEGCFRRAVEIDKAVAEGHFNLGVALAGLRKFDEAEVALKQGVRRDERLTERANTVLAAIRAERKAAREVLPPPRADDAK